MTDAKATGGLVQVWITVTDRRGDAHLEARWMTPEMAAAQHAPHAA
jgi:hypothetical protein